MSPWFLLLWATVVGMGLGQWAYDHPDGWDYAVLALNAAGVAFWFFVYYAKGRGRQ